MDNDTYRRTCRRHHTLRNFYTSGNVRFHKSEKKVGKHFVCSIKIISEFFPRLSYFTEHTDCNNEENTRPKKATKACSWGNHTKIVLVLRSDMNCDRERGLASRNRNKVVPCHEEEIGVTKPYCVVFHVILELRDTNDNS